MKRIFLFAIVFALCFSCLGTRARDDVMMPAVQMAWVGVHADLDRGIAIKGDTAASASVQALDEAITTGNRLMVSSVSWDKLEPFGQAGINDYVAKQEIDELVALSLRERLHNFGVSLLKLSQ